MTGVIFSLPWFKHWVSLPEAKSSLVSVETPIEATHFLLQEQLPGQLFHDQAFGSYLIWAAHPTYPVFVDPRIELYPPKIWLDYLAISGGGCEWEQLLSEYAINTLMLNPQEQAALVKAATDSPNWQLVYQDPHAVIFTRSTNH